MIRECSHHGFLLESKRKSKKEDKQKECTYKTGKGILESRQKEIEGNRCSKFFFVLIFFLQIMLWYDYY